MLNSPIGGNLTKDSSKVTTKSIVDRAERRLHEIANQWRGLRSRKASTDSWEYQQTEHWFYCLVEILGVKRMANEDVDGFIARMARN
jgi:hypothetical protein